MKRGCHVMVNMKSGERCGNTKEHKTYKWLTERLFFKMCKWNPLTCKWVFVLFHKNNNNIVPLRKCTNGIIHRSSILIILDLSSTSHEMKWAKHLFSKKAWSTTSYLYWQLVVVTIDGFLFFCLCFLYVYIYFWIILCALQIMLILEVWGNTCQTFRKVGHCAARTTCSNLY
jgi:hypothetical protein